MSRHLLIVSLLTCIALVTAQDDRDQSGFIMIDCGTPTNTSYTDAATGIYYVSDTNYIDTGVNAKISSVFSGLERQYQNLRAFPEGNKHCYTLIPPYAKDKTRYFIRARFVYGNYDNKNKAPTFDIYLGVNYWATVDDKYSWYHEVLYTPTANYTYVCLVNTGRGTPYISVLELRLVDSSAYDQSNTGESMELSGRYDSAPYLQDPLMRRYKDDIYDRMWSGSFFRNTTDLNTTKLIASNSFGLPYVVISTALSYSQYICFTYNRRDSTVGYYVFLHFADFQSVWTREFGIYINGEAQTFSGFRPVYLESTTFYTTRPKKPATEVVVCLRPTDRSILPPILNALELYLVILLNGTFTNTRDVDAIKDIKATYGLEKNWQGDPCSPRAQLWEGIVCYNDSSLDAPRIVSLTMSFSGLRGEVSPSIFNLTLLRHLDLSYNNLTGEVPKFLTQMSRLQTLILSGNNFTGTIPAQLLERSQEGSLLLSLEGNPYLCKQKSCEVKPIDKEKEGTKEQHKIGIGAVIAIIVGAAFIVLLIAFGILWKMSQQQQKQPQAQPHPQEQQPQTQQYHQQPEQQQHETTVVRPVESDNRGTTMLKSKDRHFSYSEVMRMTGNFGSELGGGGFGKVYHGYLNEKQVAVKMLSPSSAQGYKQFKAEAKLLTRVHHRNLTTLVGYCNEGDNLGLIYEFMANGDLRSQLSERNPNSLSWETRIEIALDAARGLEYLHFGCTPPIIHRDVKSTNILLDDMFQAKLGDFGLSKVFPTEDSTHVSTTFAGTPGYIDPEFNVNEKSDVFSFGVVLLELITGQPAISRSQTRMHLTDWVRDVIAEGDIRNVVDPRLGREFDVNSMWKVIDLAMDCVSQSSSQRPIMNIVVMELKTCLVMEKTRTTTTTTGYRSNDSGEISTLNIETTGFTPYAR